MLMFQSHWPEFSQNMLSTHCGEGWKMLCFRQAHCKLKKNKNKNNLLLFLRNQGRNEEWIESNSPALPWGSSPPHGWAPLTGGRPAQLPHLGTHRMVLSRPSRSNQWSGVDRQWQYLWLGGPRAAYGGKEFKAMESFVFSLRFPNSILYNPPHTHIHFSFKLTY